MASERSRRRALTVALAACVLSGSLLAGRPVAAAPAGAQTTGFGTHPNPRLRPPPDSGALRVVRAAPKGQLSSSGQASELRWVFDRPVVELSAIDERPAVAANVTITPSVAGAFRWASTRTLVFTPAKRLPRSTRYTVELRGLTALDGSRLASPLKTTFDTPRVRCSFEGTDGRAGLVAVRCDQPVDGKDVAAHVRLRPRQQEVDLTPFRLPAPDRQRLQAKDPASLDRLDAALARLARGGAVLGETAVTFQKTAACPNDRTRSCLWLVPRAQVPPDADVEVAFLDGIGSKEGPLASQNVLPGRFPTPETPLVGMSCTGVCTVPADGFRLVTRGSFEPSSFDGKLTVREVDGQGSWTYRRPADGADELDPLSLRWAPIQPRRAYDVEVDPAVVAADGSSLGIRFLARVTFGGRTVTLAVREGEVVREAGQGLNLPVVLRNVTKADVVVAPVGADRVAMLRRSMLDGSDAARAGLLGQFPVRAVDVPRRIDAVQTYPIAVSGPGAYLVAVRGTAFESKSEYPEQTGGSTELRRWHVALVQITDTAVTIKKSPTNVVLSTTSLTTGKPLGGVPVQLQDASGSGAVLWRGTTDKDGFAWAPTPAALSVSGELLALASGGPGGAAYASTSWGTGGPVPFFEGRAIEGSAPPAAIGKVAGPDDRTPTTLRLPTLAQGERYVGSAFTDRGVYRPGEEVHVRGQIRVQAPRALHLPPPLGAVPVTVTNDDGATVKEQSVPVDSRGGWELAFTLPDDARHGDYLASVGGLSNTSFLVTEFRRPDFQVDVVLDHTAPAEYVNGDTVKGTVTGRYLFGEPMRDRDAAWTLTEDGAFYDPTAKHPELGLQGYSWDPACVWYRRCASARGELAKGSGTLDAQGQLAAEQTLAVRKDAHGPATITLESTVTNVDRQVIANRTTALVHPGEFYVGVRSGSYFGQKGKALTLSVAALTPAGAWKPGVAVTARLMRWDWADAQNNGPRAVEVGRTTVTSAAGAAVPVTLTPDQPGQYEVRVEATDARGNHVEAGTLVYVLGGRAVIGAQSTAVEVVPQRAQYRLGETAELLVRSPWPDAEAMVSVERDDVISARRLTIAGGAASVQIPLDEDAVPSVTVSVTVFKPRTQGTGTDADPAVSVGSTMLTIAPERQKLGVSLTTDAGSYRPGAKSTATIRVTDAGGRPAAGRVTLWAVDEGVLRLTAYELPNLLDEFFAPRGSAVTTADSRARLSTPADDLLAAKSADRAAAGLAAPAAEMAAQPAFTGPADEQATAEGDVRTDLRILATWQGSVAVGAAGTATSTFTLPQSLTSYRLLAVADSGDDRFGGATTVVQTRQPLMVQPALPRFASLGDTFEAGAVIQNQTGAAGAATVTFELPAGSPVTVDGPATRTLTLPTGPTEVRFRLKATALGTLRGVLRARLGAATDAVQVGFPVLVTRRTETVAAAGVVEAGGKPDVEQVRLPGAVYPDLGGLDLAVSSSALAGLQNGVAELVEYPYGCLEQRSSRLRVLLMLQDLKQSFPIPALGGQDLRTAIVAELARMPEYQTSGGGLAYWPGGDVADLFLSARVLVLLLDARDLGYQPPAGVVEGLVAYLQAQLNQPDARRITRPAADPTGLWYNRAHILYALARAGQPQLERAISLWSRREYLSVLEQIHLVHALVLSGDTSTRASVLLGELLNGLRVEADQAFLQDDVAYDDERVCPCMAYLFPDRGAAPHDSAALLSLLVRVDPKDPATGQMARWLLAQRDAKGAWRNTLENGYALTGLVDYYKAAEPVAADFRAKVLVGAVTAYEGTFSGRSLAIQSASLPMAQLAQAVGDPSRAVPLTVSADGAAGRLFWTARLTYAPSAAFLPAQASGFSVVREYLPVGTTQGAGQATTTFPAGALVRVRLKVTTAQARRNVVVDDPLPAGLEALNPELASTARSETAGTGEAATWTPGIDHVELHDERVLLFATSLRPGTLTYTYVARATAPGTFTVAPTQVAEMYRPELFGRTASATVTVTP